jgi:hypothetical protein
MWWQATSLAVNVDGSCCVSTALLSEIDAGICEGMTYAEVQRMYVSSRSLLEAAPAPRGSLVVVHHRGQGVAELTVCVFVSCARACQLPGHPCGANRQQAVLSLPWWWRVGTHRPCLLCSRVMQGCICWGGGWGRCDDYMPSAPVTLSRPVPPPPPSSVPTFTFLPQLLSHAASHPPHPICPAAPPLPHTHPHSHSHTPALRALPQYLDVIERVKPLILELERMRGPVLIICHQAVARTLLAYFTDQSLEEMVDRPVGGCPSIIS